MCASVFALHIIILSIGSYDGKNTYYKRYHSIHSCKDNKKIRDGIP